MRGRQVEGKFGQGILCKEKDLFKDGLSLLIRGPGGKGVLVLGVVIFNQLQMKIIPQVLNQIFFPGICFIGEE